MNRLPMLMPPPPTNWYFIPSWTSQSLASKSSPKGLSVLFFWRGTLYASNYSNQFTGQLKGCQLLIMLLFYEVAKWWCCTLNSFWKVRSRRCSRVSGINANNFDYWLTIILLIIWPYRNPVFKKAVLFFL